MTGPVEEVLVALRAHLRAEEPVALATVIALTSGDGAGRSDGLGAGADGAAGEDAEAGRADTTLGATMLIRRSGPAVGSLGNDGLDGSVARDALGLIDAGSTELRHYGPRGQLGQHRVSVFVQAFAPAPRLIIFGAVDFSAALARVAKVLSFHVTVCDARSVFATRERFPMADEVVAEWPDRYLGRVGDSLGPRDAVCVLTHDPKFDVPAIVGALGTSVGYVGAMGSRRTTVDREARLRDAGVTDEELNRIMAPIGLDIGARTPAETAISICAEIVSVRSGGGTGSSLRTASGPIHKSAVG